MDRDFLAAVGYLPIGERAIRADMVERLAWVARNAVRASREAHRAWQETPKAPAARVADTPSAEGVVSEWMIAAAALGEWVEQPAAPAEAPAAESPAPEPAPAAAPAPVWTRGSPETGGAIPVAEMFVPGTRTWVLAEASKDTAGNAVVAPEKPTLPPGHFRIMPEMLSLIGCSEAEMTVILRALGYRVHQPPEGAEGPTTFSMRPRFQRERDEGRGPRPEWRRRRRNDQAPSESAREGRSPRRERRFEAPTTAEGAALSEAGLPGGDDHRPPRRERGPREERGERAGAGGKPGGALGERRGNGERRGGGFGPSRDRRDRDRESGPEVRLVATTEKKGDRPASDSPFAKLLELKLGKT
jgi:ATP-dependent RNA helicase SUPV3L1/SUV3